VDSFALIQHPLPGPVEPVPAAFMSLRDVGTVSPGGIADVRDREWTRPYVKRADRVST